MSNETDNFFGGVGGVGCGVAPGSKSFLLLLQALKQKMAMKMGNTRL